MSETLIVDESSEAAAAPPPPTGASYGFSPSMVSLLSPLGPQADAIRALRTHIVAQHVNHGRRALAVCAPTSGVGCTFIAANMAASISQSGLKTLLIDGDLRHPSLERLIRPAKPAAGLAHYLETPDALFAASIDDDVLPNLSVMYAGRVASNAQELLAGEKFEALMNWCLREYDLTIVDTPPANKSSDARRISAVLGYSLIVTAREKTIVKDVEVLIGQLKSDHAVVIGTVLNRG